MAALDGKITISIDYRPCIVHIPEESVRCSGGKRRIVTQDKNIKALFHCWSHRSAVVGESYLRGGHAAGQVSSTFAIVEFEDGTVHEVEPWNIRFVDNLMEEYDFTESRHGERK